MLVIAKENDIGFALLIFTLFMVMLWITTGRVGYIVFGLLLFAVGAYVAVAPLRHLPRAGRAVARPVGSPPRSRTPCSTHPPVACFTAAGDQLANGWYALGRAASAASASASAGLRASGCALFISALTSDMIFAAIGYQLGLMGTAVVALGFLLLVGTGLRIAQTARSDFARLVAVGLTTLLGFQAFFIMAGVTRLLPLPGSPCPSWPTGARRSSPTTCWWPCSCGSPRRAARRRPSAARGSPSPASGPSPGSTDRRLSRRGRRRPSGSTSPSGSKSRSSTRIGAGTPWRIARVRPSVGRQATTSRPRGPESSISASTTPPRRPAQADHLDGGPQPDQDVGEQLVGERARRRHPPPGVREGGGLGQPDRQGQQPVGLGHLPQRHQRMGRGQVDGDVEDHDDRPRTATVPVGVLRDRLGVRRARSIARRAGLLDRATAPSAAGRSARPLAARRADPQRARRPRWRRTLIETPITAKKHSAAEPP